MQNETVTFWYAIPLAHKVPFETFTAGAYTILSTSSNLMWSPSRYNAKEHNCFPELHLRQGLNYLTVWNSAGTHSSRVYSTRVYHWGFSCGLNVDETGNYSNVSRLDAVPVARPVQSYWRDIYPVSLRW